MKNIAVCTLEGTIIVSIVLLGLARAQAQGGVPKFIYAKSSVRTVVAAAKPFVVEVALTIDKQYHIQANSPKKDYIPTVVEFGPVSGFKVVKIVYPKAVVATVAGISLPVYEGAVVILATLTADESVKPGTFVLPVTIRFQGCSDVSCYPPKSLTIEASGSLGMGLAVPYLALGFGLIKALPRAGEWLVEMKHIFGLLLFGMGIYYLQLLLGSTVYRYVFRLYGVIAGAYLILLDKTAQNHAKFLAFKRGVGACAIAIGIYAFAPSAGAAPKMVIAFADVADFKVFQSRVHKARADGKNVLVDFRATWCAACKGLDEETFHNAAVVKANSEYVSLRVDLTDFDGDSAEPFRALFDIAGLPTIVHLTPESSAASTKTDQVFAK